MRHRQLRTGLIAGVLAAVGALGVAALPASGQIGGGVADKDQGKIDPPMAQFKNQSASETMPMIWAILLIGIAVGANLVPTRRGHQD